MTAEKTSGRNGKNRKKLTRGREKTKPGIESVESDRWRNNFFRFISVYFAHPVVAEINPGHQKRLDGTAIFTQYQSQKEKRPASPLA
jgi:hypothetical protein